LRLILIESLDAYFQLFEVCNQDEVEQRSRGSRDLAVHHLVLEWAAKVGHGKMVLKQFQKIQTKQAQYTD
jgi:hypothetical protein